MSNFGILIRSSGTFSDSSLPVYTADDILSAGSLFLSDVRTLPSGVPTANQSIRNIAAEKCALLGINGDASGKFLKLGTPVENGYAFLERTAKGGIHCIVSNAQSSYTTYQGFRVQIPMNIMNYMIANRGNTFYISQWRNITRVAGSAAGAPSLAGIESDNASGWGRFTTNSAQLKPAGSNLDGREILPAYNTLGNNYEAIAGRIPSTDTLSSTAFDNNSGVSRDVAQWGRIGRQTQNPSVLPSFIFYRGYIEDLTVSGRTWAQVNALDKAMYSAAFSAGGRFYGDSYTAASALP